MLILCAIAVCCGGYLIYHHWSVKQRELEYEKLRQEETLSAATENFLNLEKFRKMKEKTPARLGSGRAGARYKTLTMLRFRADHAAAQDAVFSQVSEDFAAKNGMVEVRTKCRDKDEYLTRPDLGRCFDCLLYTSDAADE